MHLSCFRLECWCRVQMVQIFSLLFSLWLLNSLASAKGGCESPDEQGAKPNRSLKHAPALRARANSSAAVHYTGHVPWAMPLFSICISRVAKEHPIYAPQHRLVFVAAPQVRVVTARLTLSCAILVHVNLAPRRSFPFFFPREASWFTFLLVLFR